MNYTNIIMAILVIGSLVFGAISCKRSANIEQDLSEEIQKLALSNGHLALQLNRKTDTLREVSAKLVEASAKDLDVEDNVEYIARYRSDGVLEEKLNTLTARQAAMTDTLINKDVQLLKLQEQFKALQEYCDNLIQGDSTDQEVIDRIVRNSDLLPLSATFTDLPWVTAKMTADLDTSSLLLTLVNDLTITQLEHKKKFLGWLRRKDKEIVIGSLNPYFINQQATVYQVK